MYTKASICLRSRADQLSSSSSSSTTTPIEKDGGTNTTDKKREEERRKIISLYRAQSLEYLYKARQSFIMAITNENDQDRQQLLDVAKSGTGKLDPTMSCITLEESEDRRAVFQTLFAGLLNEAGSEDDGKKKMEECCSKCKHINEPKEERRPSTQMNDDVVKDETIHPADNSIESMEARLAKLNASLANNATSADNMTKNSNNSIPPNVPPPFISGSRSSYNNGSDQSRLQNIHDGLKRLGVSIPNNNKASIITTTENLSEDEQVKLIIEQAQDEVRIERTEGRKHEIDNTSSVDSNNVLDYMNEDDDDIDENDSMFDDYEDEEDDIESLLMKAENLVAKTSAEIKGNMMSNTSSSLPISKEKVELAQLRKAQALLLEARLFLDMGSSAEEELDEGEDNNEKENGSSDKPTKHDPTNNDKKVSSARIKAKERVEDADKCLKEVLLGWG
ncbi:hypothetical protein ACHAWC_004480 [Mediolabrus comicus]